MSTVTAALIVLATIRDWPGPPRADSRAHRGRRTCRDGLVLLVARGLDAPAADALAAVAGTAIFAFLTLRVLTPEREVAMRLARLLPRRRVGAPAAS